jgi:uncharacterized protein (DUF2126 family)/transglutaminase-like putative cysteine protease
MGIQVALKHRTQYRYDKPVSLGPQTVQLRPAPHCRTPILSYSLEVTPADRILKWHLDAHANHVARMFFPSKTEEFAVEVDLVADLSPVNPFDFFLEPGIENYPFSYAPELEKNLRSYLDIGSAGPRLRALIDEVSSEARRGASQGTIGFLVALNHRVRDAVGYVIRMDPGVQDSELSLAIQTGSCRDSAWLLVEVLRHLGLAARFVSGYLIQLAADADDGTDDGVKADSADLHAWAEAFLPGAGWIGMDPTSGLFAGEGHIPLVCTPNPATAAPIGGTVEPAKVEFAFSMSVRRLHEAPSIAKPISDQEWERVRGVARAVDEELSTQDARLTMGGEPTFVGLDEPESRQWNLDALGELKRTRGLALIRGLRERTSNGAMLHYGQGKWYPGEPLPRWALSCYWRADGVAIWEDIDWIAREEDDFGLGLKDAMEFAQALARRLEVSGENLLAAFNPGESPEPAGYVLPLRRRQPNGQLRWSSQLWFPRPERLLLSPGDSPAGYRIPTEAMPWVAPDEFHYEPDAPPYVDRAKLPSAPERRIDLFAREPEPDPLPPLSSSAEGATELIRPSLCVQARDGRLHVFLPYAAQLADYLGLVAAVEDTCRHLRKRVWLEGYPPPPDPRLRFFSVTPDPGVLEINLPPSRNWDELEQTNTILFEEARKNRLTAEKFAYDGTHLATGGGSHIVIGGASLAESPLIRRPDVLRSMIAFWQNHPSLSYLFSGMYVGPTSQYPRVDEARMDALYELELAFAHLPCGECPPYILDGLFRNLLVDVTGNSHRAEFCVDKLYPPEGTGRRLGLLELRAFEMASHLRMGLMQLLLVRALVCLFWKRPFENGLVRWGTALHDRFMLPHFVERDFAEVVGELQRAGFAFDAKWFAAQHEFRFPEIGSIEAEGVELELRHALEPWNVLAEETTSGGTVRSVDSSLERIQVKLSGFAAEGRYAVACNGRKVPLTPTGRLSESVAGLRYRARMLSSTLHPTIPVHMPLEFNLIDLDSGLSVGRCTYHGGPPDGSIYSNRPANAHEANQRRLARFQVSSDRPAPMATPTGEVNPVFPMTLDLRRPAPNMNTSMDQTGTRQ